MLFVFNATLCVCIVRGESVQHQQPELNLIVTITIPVRKETDGVTVAIMSKLSPLL